MVDKEYVTMFGEIFQSVDLEAITILVIEHGEVFSTIVNLSLQFVEQWLNESER